MTLNRWDVLMAKISFCPAQADRRSDPTKEGIDEFERNLGYELPADYKEFLLKYGVTGSDGAGWSIRAADGSSDGGVDVFFGISPASDYDLAKWTKSFDGLPPTFLPIATSSGGFIVMPLAGNDKGHIYWWHPEESFGSETTELKAKDFESFMNRLSKD